MEGEEKEAETVLRAKKRKAYFITSAESTVPKTRKTRASGQSYDIRVQHPRETATPTSTRGSADLGRTEEGDSEDPPPAPEQVTDEDPPATAQGSEDTWAPRPTQYGVAKIYVPWAYPTSRAPVPGVLYGIRAVKARS